MAAGDSAAQEAVRQRSIADEHARLAGIATQMARNFAAAASSEHRLAHTLIELEQRGYSLLSDRRWPGSSRANVDFVLAGPGGVFLVDAKSWREVIVHDDRVHRGDADVTEEFAPLADLRYLTQTRLADIGLAAGEVHAIAAFTNQPGIRGEVYGVAIRSERDTVLEIARRGSRLTQQQVAQVRTALEQLFPPITIGPDEKLDTGELEAVDASIAEPVQPAGVRAADQPLTLEEAPLLLVAADIHAALVEGMLAQPIEDWMAFLHPMQARVVRRSFNGPSRVRGAAGTGKTVVALHRAAHLARSGAGKVLVTSYVNTLPRVLAQLMERLAPDVAGRVEFRSVHSFASQLLRARGHHLNIDERATDRIFLDLWESMGKDGELGRIEPMSSYWRDEIKYVLKGRGLSRFEDYAELPRVGRRRALTVDQRREVWALYFAYENALAERDLLDWENVILDAEASLRQLPLEGYDAVVVDEAQDLSCAMIRMLHSLVGDRVDGFNLVGDGQQTVYPGGYTLAEAGVPISGRAVVLGTNYRNTVEIVEFASSLVRGDTVPDIEGPDAVADSAGQGRAEVLRHGSRPSVTQFPSRAVHDRSLVERVRRVTTDSDTGLGDVAVLSLTNWHAREAAETLEAAGIPTIDLEKYDGRTVNAVKVGTIKRAKGLEFKEVLVVRTPPHLVRPATSDVDEAGLERRELQRRELYVAMTRARDGLWVGVA